MAYKLEIIAFDIESCISAQQHGADRIELCDNFSEGGTTPSYGFIKKAREKLSIELYVMIRPRGGDFLYSNEDFQIMVQDIAFCKSIGCDGIVLGLLIASGNVDKERCQKLIEYAYPLGVTFHRAFDRAKDPFQALEDIIEIGCERILTSGQKPKAMEGIELISQLVRQADGRIIIMPGSGVNAENIKELAEKTNAMEFHSSASVMMESKMEFENKLMNERLQRVAINKDEIIAMKKIIQSL
ncbi:MAG: copper homeostasis protein CutC [Bacteroidota bacterium]|nr:copper homeostasis protein CutC [Bacteroidota bacterium]